MTILPSATRPPPAAKPTVVLAPGAWHTPDCYDEVRERLSALGYPTQSVAYPSVGAEPPTATLSDDVAAVRGAVAELADAGKSVVLVVHSYGGCVGASAVEGLGARTRARAGKKGGVVMFVYLAAFVVPKGKCLFDMFAGNAPAWLEFDGNYCTPATPAQVFYHDMPAPAQAAAIAKIQHQSAPVFQGTVTYEPWHDMPCTYLFCAADQAIPLAMQQQMAAVLGPETTTFSFVGSHSPFLSQPQEVVEAVEFAAKVGVERAKRG
ncbi:uncharacterized protein K452DRAFT_232993 [Aplosporella prunicola CBS 121167]|uniref:AB hydrolase-1 domain-containing protein n=1 Tax=Aplosporella prunicola CBS 121167 TaxID=1176127 RepID=A0A6A6B5P9_9PEZI|nr:uncharacterized protein K452DRAFT_232993 [Aplosporella prunicola CBS 121167]KAF2139186.1 hypothetical protein K452DRAFT_232993 [Aplosporella prunicola CBS 121167]